MSFHEMPEETRIKIMEARLFDFKEFVLNLLLDGALDVCHTVEEALESAMEVYIDHTENV